MAGGLGFDATVLAAQGDDQRFAADLVDSPAGRLAADGDLDLLHAVLGRHVDDAGHLRVQGEAGHLRAAGLVGGDDPVGAGAAQLAFGILDAGPGDDRDVGAQLARGQRDEDVLGVGVDAGHDPGGVHDSRRAQHLVVGGRSLDEGGAHRFGALARVLGVDIEHDEGAAGGAQVAARLAADAAEAADHVVVPQRIDLPQHPSLLEQAGEMAGNEELGDRDESVEEGTHAEDDQPDLEQLAAGAGRLGDRADRGDRVERPDEAEADRGPFGDHVAGGAERQQTEDRDPEHAEAPDQIEQRLAVSRHGRPAQTAPAARAISA